ncbi:MAG: malto-oligosyltrehalose synthase [Reyranella sp.]|uniref:malto-oligosyltrehalose synthase n=1 Tax=Reyranella sp. TaxID=1929291 RepID=UPI0011F81224|nr:malto-oligosyltrehalose synthase [Reyranella sp.]TAJ87250.1 MAG: malto-oligosyltrehalose synthase [Reyranella sp.]
MIPRATLRLQFHRGFGFAEGAAHADYFARLGISHVYASPIAVARPGSLHGYDVLDPTAVNPELGGEEGLLSLTRALRAVGVGLILDVVPNHMAADTRNRWWRDVLRRGRASRHAEWFDIDWETTEGPAKILLPVLGRPLSEVIEAGELSVVRDDRGRPELRYFENAFPLCDGGAEGRGSLANLLARQHYRLASWRVAGDRINWRRFFDINELVCLRMEQPEAFEAVHALPLRLYAEGVVDGLRIDHVDGLTDPAGYCRQLRERLDLLAREHGRPRAWLVVEKILLKGETLPKDWGCDGTTGYDFMDEVSALQHDPAGEATLTKSWTRVSRRPAGFADEELMARREIVARSFSAQLEACGTSWQAIVADLIPRPTLRRLLTEFLAHVPVYRTYGAGKLLSDHDSEILREVAGKVAKSCLATDRWAVEPLLEAMLTPDSKRGSWPRAMARFQQLSAPVAAKSVEDTGFYRYGRLLSRNDVGFDIETFALDADAFHARMERRRADYPHTMLATATHDHKRGEDVRARLAVVSELAAEWAGLVSHWIDPTSSLVSPGDQAMLLQMIVGAWPLDLDRGDEAGRRAFAERLCGWQQKALREAKLESDWAAVNEPYEEAARTFTMRLVAEAAMPDLLDDLLAFVRRIAPAGAVNGLAQCLLKLTVPGVPDLYQGADLWDFSLVDPDNRRPVDFAARATMQDAPLPELMTHWRDGRIKQALIRRTLSLRRRAPRLFAEGRYRAVEVEGPSRDSVVAFLRQTGEEWLLVAVPRVVAPMMPEEGNLAFRPDAWSGTSLRLAGDFPKQVHDILRGRSMELSPQPGLGVLWNESPVALLSSVSPG